MLSPSFPLPPSDSPAASSAADALVIPVIEERVTVSREVVETGRVRLTKTVHEHEEEVPLDLRHEEVDVERVPLNQFLPDDAPVPTTRHEGDTLIVPVLREVLVKRLLLVEELRVTKRRVTTQEPQHVSLRHEHVAVEHLPGADSPAPAS